MAGQKTVISLDIGKYAVKALWAETRKNNIAIQRIETIRLPQDASDLTELIKPWIKKLQLTGKNCILSLPAQEIIFQPLTLPPSDPRTIEQAASIEVIRFNEMASEAMEYGYLPFRGSPGERRLLLAMVRPSILTPILSTINTLEIKILDLIPVPAALFAVFADSPENHSLQPVAFVEIGHSVTSLAVGMGGELIFARTFPAGGRTFTEAIARAKKITHSQADTLKQTASFADKDEEVRKSIEEAAVLWLSELKSCLSVYSSLFSARTHRIAKIYITGGGSELNGFIQHIASRIEIPVARPSVIIEGMPQTQLASSLTVATGLAKIALLKKPEQRLSLLPRHLRDELVFRQQKPYWIASAAVAGLTFAVFLAGGMHDIKRKESHLQKQRAGLARRQELAAKIEESRLRIEQIKTMSQPLQSLLTVGSRIRDILITISSLTSLRDKDRITMICDADSYFSQKPFSPYRKSIEDTTKPSLYSKPMEKEEKTPPPINTIIIEGYTSVPDFSTVHELIIKIASLDFVKNADLLRDDKLTTDASDKNASLPPDFLRFVIEVKLKEI